MKAQEMPLTSGERLSFLQLFAQKNLSIEIPIIQRDYAQGRKTTREVRIKFLEALYGYLDENQPYRDLDFVYGSISRREDDTLVFIPLDGQQRLTTLFLLHWYLALISHRHTDLQQYLIAEKKSRFTYETRSSAREFCDALMINSHTISPEDGPVSEAIQNSGWYFMSWKHDPTVQSMLTMLDAIEEQFKERPGFFSRLVDLMNPVITFQFLDLREFQLTDDLYIKMNSRGKPLTKFENFKAKLAQRIDELFRDEDQRFTLKRESGDILLNAHDYFAWKIDTDWADFFWKNRDTTNLYDSRIMNFIRVVLANWFAVNWNQSKGTELSHLFGTQVAQKSEGYSDDLSYFDYLEYGVLTRESIQVLTRSFDALLRSEELKDNLPDRLNYEANQVLQTVLLHSLSNSDRIKFHAFLGYLSNYDSTSGLMDWMRVVHNLSENTRIDHMEDLVRCLTEIDKLLPKGDQILEYLASGHSSVGAFYQSQVQEEEVKASLILKNDQWSNLIRQTDRNLFFNGQIAFLLEFSGILAYVECKGNYNWTDQDDQIFVEKFKDYRYKADASFAYVRDLNDEFLWERALLSKGDYLITASYWRKNFLNTNANARDYSWKRLLRLSGITDNDKQELTQRRLFIKDVFDDNRFDPLDVGESCKTLIQDVPEDWRSYFVRNHKLIEVCTQGFIRFENEAKIRLLTKSRLTYHYELRSYNLYLEKIKGHSFLPFDNTTYMLAYGEYGVCHVELQNCVYNGQTYFMRVSFIDQFIAEFYRNVKGQVEPVDEATVEAILVELKFVLIDAEKKLHTWTGENDDAIMKMIDSLCQKLSTFKA